MQRMRWTAEEVKAMTVLPRLGDCFSLDRGDPVPANLIGARIVGFGAPDYDVEGGGLVIDYVPAGQDVTRRVVFAFTELGMWMDGVAVLDQQG